MRALLFMGVVLLASAGCTPVDYRSELLTPVSSGEMTAAPGANVVSIRATKSLPNAFGAADVFGRRTDAGRTFINFVGVDNGKAVFVRQDHVIDSNATTMSESAMIVPEVSTSRASGYVGDTYFAGTGETTNYRYVPPKGSQQSVYSQPPVAFTLAEGESYEIEGRTLRITKIEGRSIRYTLR